MSKDMDGLLNLVHKIVDVVDRTNKKICVTLVRYNVYETKKAYRQAQLFAGKEEDESFQQIVLVNYKLEEIIYLFHVVKAVTD